jgi:uncharacterized UPF0146 family protein
MNNFKRTSIHDPRSTIWNLASLSKLTEHRNRVAEKEIQKTTMNYLRRCPENKRVLEFCVGNGRSFEIAPELKTAVTHVTDWNHETLPTVLPEKQTLERLRVDLRHLHRHVHDIDLCYGIHGLDTIPSGERLASLEALFNALKPGGYLLHFMDANTLMSRVSDIAKQQGFTPFDHVCFAFSAPGSLSEANLVFVSKAALRDYFSHKRVLSNKVKQFLNSSDYKRLRNYLDSPSLDSVKLSFDANSLFYSSDAMPNLEDLPMPKPGTRFDKLKRTFKIINLGDAFSDRLASELRQSGFNVLERQDTPDVHVVVVQKPATVRDRVSGKHIRLSHLSRI